MEYYESRLDETGRRFYQEVVRRLKDHAVRVRAPRGMAPEQMMECIHAVLYDVPELFYVEAHEISYTVRPGGLEYNPRYRYPKGESDQRRRRIEEQAERILKGMQRAGAGSVYQRCGWLHHYLVRHCTYDEHAPGHPDICFRAYTIEGVFLEQKAVCEGIALAYRYLCKKAGIEAIAVTGVSLRPGGREREKHAWNIVRAGRAAAHVDVTWDMCMSSAEGIVRCDYFFLPDQEMTRDHQYAGYPVCGQSGSGYFERFGRQFSEPAELGAYIRKEYARPGREEKLILYFKIRDQRMTKEEVDRSVAGQIRQCTDRGFSYSYNINETQSVFYYCITFS